MKKILISALLLAVSSVQAADIVKKSDSLVSIDSILLMQDSTEGKLLSEKFQKEVEDFRTQVKTEQDKLVDLQKTIEKQAKVLSKEAKLEKIEELEKMKKTAERNLADMEEGLKTRVQRQQFVLREKQMKVVNNVCKKQDWGLMIDKNVPGVLFVNNAIDKTEEVLKAVNVDYEKELKSSKTVNTDSSTVKKIKAA